jgi:hypothetical protein
MTDPYQSLGEMLLAAARRQQARAGASSRRGRWLAHRVNAVAIALLIVLAGAAVALAASGLLSGTPVKEPQGVPTFNSGTGVSRAGGGQLLALRIADPEGGLPWGMRLVHTTRGETCVQIGRVQNGQLGQLGIDGAFSDDGRFHPLSVNTLPNYTNGYADLNCLLPGEVMLGNAPSEDRNAEWGVGRNSAASARQLRAISWGLLGQHAVSVTYQTSAGPRSVAVSPGVGAFMIVQPVRQLPRRITIAGLQSGSVTGHDVGLDPPGMAITYRFGSFVCSVGALAKGRRCPAPPPLARSAFLPTRSLRLPVRVMAVAQSHVVCSAAFLLDPCYRAQVQFKAPYAITSAAADYTVMTSSSCRNATPSSWPIDRDVARGETVRSLSLGEFNCLSDTFEVEYRNLAARTSSAAPGHESVIVGIGRLGKPGREDRSAVVRVVAPRARPKS